MKSRWDDRAAESLAALAGNSEADRDLAMRIYTSRLIGRDPDLVLHGGGNTSVKTARYVDGAMAEVIHVKGSGWDLDTIEGPGLPSLRLRPLLDARNGRGMNDEEMVAFLRGNLLDPASPNPSVETLLHAYLPAKFVDHTHASAVLALADQPNSGDIARSIYGRRIAVVPYVMPGFDLSIEAAKVFAENPDCEGLWLDNHGLFTFGATARESYERMIELVELAERHLAVRGSPVPAALPTRPPTPEASTFVERLVGVLREAGQPFSGGVAMDYRSDSNVDTYLRMPDLEAVSARGTLTPDHVIRIKPFPLVADVVDDAAILRQRVGEFASRYRDYFARNEPLSLERKTMLDPLPRVALVHGAGLVGIGQNEKEASIAADFAVQTARVVVAAEAYGRFEPISERDLFEMEYWSLEQAKLRRAA